MNLLRAPIRILSRTKLYWGLALICLIGAALSPQTSSGRNIFLSYQNLTDVLAAGLDHRPRGDRNDHRHPARRHRSVGRLGHGLFDGHLRDASDQAGMDGRRDHGRAGRDGRHRASRSAFLARFVFNGLARGRDVEAGRRREIVLGAMARLSHSRRSGPCRRRRGRRFRRLASSDEIRGPGGSSGDAVLRAHARRDQRRPHRQGTPSALHRDARDDGQRARHRPPDRRPGLRGHPRLHRNERDGGFRDAALDGLGPRADAEHLFPGGDHFLRRDSALHHLRPLRLRDRRQRRRRRSCPASRSSRSSSPPMSFPACWPESPAFCSSPNTGRASPTPGPASNSTRSPPSSSAGRA